MIFGYGTFYFVADSTVPGNANLNLEMLNIALQKMFATRCREGKPTPISVSEYMDGAPVNRCATVLGFLQLLVKSGLLSKAQLDIMLMGHSHELGDQNFGSVSHHFKSKGIVLRDVTDLMREIPNAFTDENLKPRDVIKIDVVHDWTAWLRPYIGQIANIKGLVPDIQRVHHLECHPDGIWYKQLQQDNGYWNRKPLDVLPYGVPEWSDLKLQLPSNHDGMKKHLKTEAQVQLNFFKLWNSHEHFRTAKHIFIQALRAYYEACFAEFSEIRVVHNEKQKRWKDREATATGKHKGHTRVADEEGSGEAAAAANVKGTSDTDWNRKPLDVLPYSVPEWSDLKLQLPSNHDRMTKHLKTQAHVQLNLLKLWSSHGHFRTAKHIFTQELRAHYEAYFAEFSEIRVVHNEKQKRWKDREATATGKHKGHTRVADEEGSGEAAAAANGKGTSDTDTSNAGTGRMI